MHYEGNIIRPPSEAHSIIIQVTTGCSHNRCTFCGAYKDTPFRFKHEYIDDDIEFASLHCTSQNRVFLADGDALILPFGELQTIFNRINTRLPWVKGISLYANGKALRSKSDEELLALKRCGLSRIYLGVESGDDITLNVICKGETSSSLIKQGQRVRRLGISLSVTVLLGVAGRQDSLRHAEKTGALLTQMSPNHIAALTLMLIPGTPLAEADAFSLLSPNEILCELKQLLIHTHCSRSQFYSNHASNYLRLSGRLQRDKQLLISTIDHALENNSQLIPEAFRAL